MTKLTVTDQFVSIYKKFNVIDQISEINNLTDFELYLLLTLVVDKFDVDDPVVTSNLKPFLTQLQEIFDIQDDVNPTNPNLLKLIDKSGDKYIDTDVIVDENGDILPPPLDKGGARNEKINLLDI